MSVPSGDAQATFAATLVDEWIRAGVAHAVLCPGSRSTPLVLALAERDEIELHVRLDERGACFYAIGLSLATERPTIVCTTSGTAAAELHAGVLEASHARVPLIVCTADRPPRLHHVGAPQTVEQANLFGTAVRWFFEPGVANGADRGWWRSLGATVVLEAMRGSGPVHLNLAFDEPLLGAAEPLAKPRADGGPWHAALASNSTPAGSESVTRRWAERGVIVAGGGAPSAAFLLGAADRLGWPVLADPRSGVRVAHPAVVGAADAILREPAARDALSPETILLFGRPPASRVVSEFVERCARDGAEVVSIGEEASIDPARAVHTIHVVDATLFAGWLASIPGSASPEWRGRWERAEAAAQGAIDKALANDPLTAGGRTTEPGTLRHLYATLEETTVVFVSSSMPVRDLEWYGAPRAAPPRVLSNRGANGIDGVTSTAFGVAAGQDNPVVAVLGDLAFLHDASALASVGDDAGSCTLVVLDNGGGGIFSFLPQAGALEHGRFERVFGTAPRVSVGEVARGFGIPVAEVSTMGALDEALGRFVGREPRSLIRVEVPSRHENVGLHERIHAAVADASRAALDP